MSHQPNMPSNGRTPRTDLPRFSVLMPTFKHAAFIRRALESLHAQTLKDWELVIIDDGSPDATEAVVAPYLADLRIRYHRLERNQGLGTALNYATSLARGRYLAYLPSDDVFYPDHLERLAALLDTNPEIYLAYGGVRWNRTSFGPTLGGAGVVGHEAAALADTPEVSTSVIEAATIGLQNATSMDGSQLGEDKRQANGNILALVQVAHRRHYEATVRWTTRAEEVSDRLEPDFWRGLLACGARFAYSGAITCEWLNHADQHHKIIAGKLEEAGLSRYRGFYGIGRGEWLNWQPTHGMQVDERARYGRFDIPRELPASDGLKILVVGELGYHPERIMAFEERGHKLYALWIPRPETWDTAGPLPYGNIESIPYDQHWQERVRAIRPDVIYALLNWQAIELIDEVVGAALGIPLVFHFKEGPFACQEFGVWPALMRILAGSDGQVFISPENFEWLQLATDNMLDPATTMILDGDLPKLDWMTDDWSPKLSAQDGQLHTVCPGRPLGISPFEEVARAGIHVHLYGQFFHQIYPAWARESLSTGFLHLHPTVEPGDWVRELSQYDAAWFHSFETFNGGDLHRANWNALNLPARVGTYAAAGLPWILKDNRHSRVAVQSLAQQYDIGLFFSAFDDLAEQLRDRHHLAQLTANMRASRHEFAFDTHVDRLIAFFRQVINQRY